MQPSITHLQADSHIIYPNIPSSEPADCYVISPVQKPTFSNSSVDDDAQSVKANSFSLRCLEGIKRLEELLSVSNIKRGRVAVFLFMLEISRWQRYK